MIGVLRDFYLDLIGNVFVLLNFETDNWIS